MSVLHSKGGKSRQLPLHPTTVDALGRYTEIRDRAFPTMTTTVFFLGPKGQPLHSHLVSTAFRGLVAQVLIGTAPGRSRGRLGDLRHTFAVRTLLAWHEAGDDVARRLPLLSAYLGHNDPSATYWYLHAAPELMAIAGHRLEQSWAARS